MLRYVSVTLRRLLPFLRGFAASAVFLGSTALPILHEWKVGSSEAEFHAAVAGPGRPTILPERSGHKHHSDSDCVLCPLLLRPAAAEPPPGGPVAHPGAGTALSALVTPVLALAASRLPPARAPPAA